MIAPRRSHWCEVPAQPTVIVMSYGQIFDMLAAIAKRRAEFVAQIHEANDPIEARLAAIDAALGETYDRETVNNLLEEKAEILTQLERM